MKKFTVYDQSNPNFSRNNSGLWEEGAKGHDEFQKMKKLCEGAQMFLPRAQSGSQQP